MLDFGEIARVKAVWHSRERPAESPPPAAMAPIQAIIEAQLPVKLMEDG